MNLLAAQTISFDPPLHTRDWFSYIVLVNLKNRKPSGLSLCPYSFYLFAFYLLNSIIYLPTSTRETPSTWKCTFSGHQENRFSVIQWSPPIGWKLSTNEKPASRSCTISWSEKYQDGPGAVVMPCGIAVLKTAESNTWSLYWSGIVNVYQYDNIVQCSDLG